MDETIQKLVAERRHALHGADDGRRPWGLALSGGGIEESSRACAQALVQTALTPTGQPWAIKLLPRPINADPGAIEVWLPRP